VNAFAAVLRTAGQDRLEELCRRLRESVASHRVGDRPNRHEPRRRKRRLDHRRVRVALVVVVLRLQCRSKLA